MASLARVLGVVCVMLAVALVALGFYVAFAETSAPGLSDQAAALARFVYLVSSVSAALVLATLGSAAYVIGCIGLDHKDGFRGTARWQPAQPPSFASTRPLPPPPY